jgi:uncharacterized protein YbjT (DUF2867 family)
VARVFVAAARAATTGARVFHLGGPAVTIAETAAEIASASGTRVEVDEDTRLPFPDEFDGSALDEALGGITWTPLREGVQQTIATLRAAPG